MAMKIGHVVCVGILLFVALYVAHMMTAHKGSQIVPGLGS